ncbi:hypothetical protein SAMN05421856_10237 [Chryseobacterium taichungense]|uniref:Uncharacterized protein n=1 Tax=Chryseobacterium taichungense TaxID=295069 RepID=A0A1H7WXT9_9FLAO|nr:hypothetical protein SAMN05421856_10237 [Chryseobacterium taichungense]
MAEVTRSYQDTTNLRHSHSQILKPFNLHLTFVILNIAKRNEESLEVINAMAARTLLYAYFFRAQRRFARQMIATPNDINPDD